MSEPFLDPATNETVISVVSPVFAKNGSEVLAGGQIPLERRGVRRIRRKFRAYAGTNSAEFSRKRKL